MKRITKVLTMVLAMALIFAACTNSATKSADSSNKGTASDGKKGGSDVTIRYLLLSSGSDLAKVQDKVNERLAELKAGYKVELVQYGWDNYATQIGLAARGTGEKFDIATTASWLGPYSTLVVDGGFLDLTDKLEKGLPELFKTLTKDQINAMKVNNKVYGVPTRYTAIMARDHFIWNVKALEELGFKPADVENLRTVESLEPMLQAYKEKYPDRYPLDGASEWALRRVDSLIKTDASGNAVIENIFAADYMKKTFETAKKYADAKYIHPDAGSDLAPKQTEPDTWLVRRGEGEPGFNAILEKDLKTPVKLVLTSEDVFIGSANLTGKLTAVYSHTQYPDQALDFINKIGTDEKIQNLLAWGIEGVHYNVKDGHADKIKDANGKDLTLYNPWQAQFVSDAKRLPAVGMKAANDPELQKEVAAFEAELKPAADLGFTPSTELQAKLGQVQAAKDTYYKDLSRGKMGQYDQFLKDLKALGIDDIIKQLQEEYSAWKKAQ